MLSNWLRISANQKKITRSPTNGNVKPNNNANNTKPNGNVKPNNNANNTKPNGNVKPNNKQPTVMEAQNKLSQR